jgi:hypothetical protein
MATSSTIVDQHQTAATPTALLISLASYSHEAFEHVLNNLSQAFAGQNVVVATPDGAPLSSPGLEVVPYNPTAPSAGGWTLTAADFINAHELARKHQASAVLQLGSEAQSLDPATLRRLAEAVLDGGNDLALPRYDLPARAGLVNSAILYPVSRALFGSSARFPLAIDLCLSARMAERLASTAQKFTSANQFDALIWPIAEACVSGFKIAEVPSGPRVLPQPAAPDFNTLLAQITGSLFADVDSKAAFWQRIRVAQSAPTTTSLTDGTFSADQVQPMLEAFQLAYLNLHEIWSLVLPPQSLLGLKRLAAMPATSFRMPDSLWARIVYDFLLAFRLRTINRGHLLGALTPLYLAWVASHILLTGTGVDPERHVETVAAAFEADKAYLVSRWRWPDRFNP